MNELQVIFEVLPLCYRTCCEYTHLPVIDELAWHASRHEPETHTQMTSTQHNTHGILSWLAHTGTPDLKAASSPSP